jgi:hypothetical protein
MVEKENQNGQESQESQCVKEEKAKKQENTGVKFREL